MKIDIHSLETYNELARDGAESAADALSELADVPARVEMTDVSLMSSSDLRYEFDGRTFAGVSVSLGSPLSGETVLVFDEDGREAITSNLVPAAGPERLESAVVEVGNIMANGFVSGWADHLDTKIDVSPPSPVEGDGASVLPDPTTADDEYVFVFRSRVRSADSDVDFRILLFPAIDALEELLEDRTGEGISLEKLEVFTEMTKQGAVRATDNLTAMTGLETTVEVNRLNFVSIPDIPAQVGTEQRVGTAVKYTGSPSGYLAILFQPASARRNVDALLSNEHDGDWSERERSALEELCNVTASGFIDGWANVLETSIRHSPPTFISDMGSSIVSPLIADLGRTDNYAFVLDSTIETEDADSLQCQLLALPRRDELEEALEALLVERVTETRADPDDHF
ncbi:chemotaxis protein CheA [Natrarchaeobius halalkaliphilus]|uniref:Chemotaxis protein CheA n=1 Tax=Natrarchaeobius halalkaliphilus TaxID=1679091 RepID=A0A3N6M443_9EURY|nr:chemotaxis protein CheC [Natrarchaeobius halalkaliphilus]RQG86917.1 chemotaxis protein CheA [Natrarchaeobius halalkaliphilus]